MGRGGNVRFHTFQLNHYGPTDQQTDEPTNGQSLLKSCVSATKKTDEKEKERGKMEGEFIGRDVIISFVSRNSFSSCLGF